MAKNPRSGKQKRREKGKERAKYWAQVMKEQEKKEKAEKAKAKKEEVGQLVDGPDMNREIKTVSRLHKSLC